MSQAAPRSGLFRRIYLSFVLTVVAFAALVALAVRTLSNQYDAAWLESVEAAVAAREDRLVAALARPDALRRELAELTAELDLRAALRDPEGHLLAGDPETRSRSRRGPRQLARLQRGQPLVQRGDRDPALALGIFAADDTLVAVLALDTGDRGQARTWQLSLALLGLLLVLAVGAMPLARSLTRRLARLEEGADRIAAGQLEHRVPADGNGDEIDRLGQAFNAMATQLGAMLRGQRALLTNVSHELRTPVARMRVLVELLGERLTNLPDPEHPVAARLRRGITEMGEDLIELEGLIGDLLTSGRLDLAGAPALQRRPTELQPLLTRAAARVAARVRCDPPDLSAELDVVLLERLLANLLHNARRACPEGQLDISATVDGPTLILAVEDEGPGIAPGERLQIFDPFTRLDAARARDHGGVGLGLYLCRQIAQAHGGTIAAEDRLDGARGARLVLRLPLVAPTPAPPNKPVTPVMPVMPS